MPAPSMARRRAAANMRRADAFDRWDAVVSPAVLSPWVPPCTTPRWSPRSAASPERQHGIVNPPVYHASTVLFPTVAAMEAARPTRASTTAATARRPAWRSRTPGALEGGHWCFVTGSGKQAITATLLALLKAGDHVLMVDSVYHPTRRFCDLTLSRFGVETSYYDPLIGAGVRELIRPNTRIVWIESPGSLTFEVQDIPAIAEAAHAAGAFVIMDNTWASPLYFKPFAHGVDISVQALTKYVGGHSDLMMGSIVTTPELPTASAPRSWRSRASPHPTTATWRCAACARSRPGSSGTSAARWRSRRGFATGPRWRPSSTPRCPARPATSSGSATSWAPPASSASSSSPAPRPSVAAMLDHMELFGMGYSWGGYESLLIPTHPETSRTAAPWRVEGVPMRIHVGLEDPADLIADLEAGFDRLAAAG